MHLVSIACPLHRCGNRGSDSKILLQNHRINKWRGQGVLAQVYWMDPGQRAYYYHCNWTPDFIHIAPAFPLMTFFCFRIPHCI